MTAWEKIGERMLDQGYRTLLGRTYRLPGGEEREFELKLEGDTAVVLAITAHDVALVREFRPGVEDSLLELPGGAVDSGEDPAEGARRELLEERGYTAELVHAGTMVDCAYSTRLRHVYATRDARRIAEPTPEPGEHLEVTLLPLRDFRAHLRSGRLTDVGPGYLALDALGLLR